MLQSLLFADVPTLATKVRKLYGYARYEVMEKLRDGPWILRNLDSLTQGDIALIAEHNRDVRVREMVVTRLRAIPTFA